jgi:hypothetical protein
MNKTILLALCLALLATPAFAAKTCYSPVELQAEQILRLHSELMVITVTCHQGSDGRDLVPAYTGFTKNNIQMLHNAEQTMTAFYKKSYKGDPVARLDRLRTLLANEYGKKIADMSAPAFCAQSRDKVTALYGYEPSAILEEVQKSNVDAQSYVPVCGKTSPAAQGKRG